MYKKKNKLTQKELKRQLHYNPNTGIFTRLISNCNSVKVGEIAGRTNPYGYIIITVNNEGYRAHRLAWLYMEGYWPEHQIDHKNGIRNDNRWINIRHVTRVCNLQNMKVYSSNTSGFPGVTWGKAKKKWLSQIRINGKLLFLGYYDDLLEAALARFTVEDQCPQWTCNHRSELTKAIRNTWPGFKNRKRRNKFYVKEEKLLDNHKSH